VNTHPPRRRHQRSAALLPQLPLLLPGALAAAIAATAAVGAAVVLVCGQQAAVDGREA